MATLLIVAVGVSLASSSSSRQAAATWRGSTHSRSGMIIGAQPAYTPAATSTRPRSLTPETCPPVSRTSGYVDPLARASLIGERIDQGVDYAGTGKLVALGTGRLTYVGTSGTGWPGAFIEYRLLAGPDAGCFVYYAEGVQPASWLRVGRLVTTGQAIASIIPGWSTGIELGWGAGRSTRTLAEMHGGWTPTDDAQDMPTRAGRSFSALVAYLGGPAGKVEH